MANAASQNAVATSEYRHPLVLFCKTFSPDVKRFDHLLCSIEKHNYSNIPLVVSVPCAELQFFRSRFGNSRFVLFTDEEITETASSRRGWHDQQVVKLMFGTHGIARNYVLIDSDFYFIRPFRFDDFMVDEVRAYTIVSSNRYVSTRDNVFLNQIFSSLLIGEVPNVRPLVPSDLEACSGAGSAAIRLSEDRDHRSAEEKATKIQPLMRRRGPSLEYAPGPIIASPAIKEFSDKVLTPNRLGYRQLMNISPWEVVWYGEWLLTSRCIDIVPKEPLFVHFASDGEIRRVRGLGITNEILARQFLGVALASRHQELLSIDEAADIDGSAPTRPTASSGPIAGLAGRLAERVRRLLR